MRQIPLRVLAVLFCMGLFGAHGALAADAAPDPNTKPPTPAAQAFEQFLIASSPVCLNQPSAHCVDIGWQFADTDHDGTLSFAEIQAVRTALQEWLSWKWPELSAKDRTNITLGLMVVDIIGLDKLFAGLNTAGNGKLSRAELLADVTLDDRPLGPVLQDPDAVDRKALAQRLGRVAPIVQSMLGEPRDHESKRAASAPSQ